MVEPIHLSHEKKKLTFRYKIQKQWNHYLAICKRCRGWNTVIPSEMPYLNGQTRLGTLSHRKRSGFLGFLIMVSKDDVKLDQQKFNSDVFWMVQPQHIDSASALSTKSAGKWHMISDSRDAKRYQKNHSLSSHPRVACHPTGHLVLWHLS